MTLIGTYYHKNLEDSYKIFKYLKIKNEKLKLRIFGEISTIPLKLEKTLMSSYSRSQYYN